MSYVRIADAKPQHGQLCVVWAGGVPHIAVWHRTMGPAGAGGDFATVKIGKHTTACTHLPGVTLWQKLEQP